MEIRKLMLYRLISNQMAADGRNYLAILPHRDTSNPVWLRKDPFFHATPPCGGANGYYMRYRWIAYFATNNVLKPQISFFNITAHKFTLIFTTKWFRLVICRLRVRTTSRACKNASDKPPKSNR